MCVLAQKSDPPDYSVTGEFSPGALVIGGEPFDVGLDELYPTAPPDHLGASPWDTVVRRGLKPMKNVFSKVSACQGVWPMHVGNACGTTGWLILAYSGLFWLILAYSGLFVDAVHASIWIRDKLHIVPKKRPPRLLRCWREHPWHSCHQGGTFECRATPDKSIIRTNVYHNNSTKRSET